MIQHTDDNREYSSIDYQNSTLKLHIAEKYKLRHLKPKHIYIRKYNIISIVIMFFVFSFLGWFWEVLFHLVADGSFINRGMLFGPWLPIYGIGGVLSLFIPKTITKNPIYTFVVVAIMFSVIEYSTSWFFEYTKGNRWWDYSEYILNINGRVCMFGAVLFGLGGCLCIYLLGPILDDLIKKIPQKIILILCFSLMFLFLADLIYSEFKPNIGKYITYCSKSTVTCINDNYDFDYHYKDFK